MRIAAKHLRYTLEIFAPVYRLGLKKYIAKVARLQKLLGDLHDTDVWIDMVSLILLKERSLPRNFSDPHRPGPGVISGLNYFLKERERGTDEIVQADGPVLEPASENKGMGRFEKRISHNRKTNYDLHREMPEEVRKALISHYVRSIPREQAIPCRSSRSRSSCLTSCRLSTSLGTVSEACLNMERCFMISDGNGGRWGMQSGVPS